MSSLEKPPSKSLNFFCKSLAIFLATFSFFMHPLAIIATTVAVTPYDSAGAANTTAPALVIQMMNQIPHSFAFNTNLSKGMRSNDVKMLQILLNTDSRTRVAETGAGSPGNETNYFGPGTFRAVQRFQTLYKAIILTPIGLTAPTGFVGSRSRMVLNQLLIGLKNSFSQNKSFNITVGNDTYYNVQNNYAGVNSNYAGVNINYSGTNINYTGTTIGLNNNLNASTTNGFSGNASSTQLAGDQQQNATGTNSSQYYGQNSTQSGTQNGTTTTGTGIYSGTTGTNSQQNTGTNSGSNNTAAIIGGAVVGTALLGSALSSSGGGSSGGIRTVFGGRIVSVVYCTCDASILLFVFDVDLKTAVQLLYIPGFSTLYTAYNVFQPGPLVLGGYIQSGVPCLVVSGSSCVSVGAPIGIIDFLRGVGTSLE